MPSSIASCSHCGSTNAPNASCCYYCGVPLSQQSIGQKKKISRRAAVRNIAIGAVVLAAVGAVYVEGKRLRDANVFLVYSGHQSPSGAAWSPDSTRVASIGAGETAVQVWDATSGRRLQTLQLEETDRKMFPMDVIWSADGKYVIAMASEPDGDYTFSEVQFWDATSGRYVRSMPVVPSVVAGMEKPADQLRIYGWALNGNYLAVVMGGARVGSTIEAWDMVTGNQIATLKLDGQNTTVANMSWAPRSTKLAVVTADWNCQIWDVPIGVNIGTFGVEDHMLDIIDWSSDEKSIAVGDAIFDVGTGMAVVDVKYIVEDTLYASMIAWSLDKRYLAAFSTAFNKDRTADNKISIIDASYEPAVIATYHETSSERAGTASRGSANPWSRERMVWSPDGKHLLVIKADGIKIWKDVVPRETRD